MNEFVTWSFFGRVLPERVPVSIQIPSIKNQNGSTYNVYMHLSQIIVICDIDKNEVNIFTIRNNVENLVRSITDIIGYERGISFDVEIISCVNNSGIWFTFGVEIPILFEKKTGVASHILSDDLNLYYSEPAVGIALADFREAMRMPSQTGFFCYRAVEAMMQSVKRINQGNDHAAWIELRRCLNVDLSAINLIKTHADWARHGRLGSLSDEDRVNIFRITDEIIRRFIEYLRSGRTQLDQLTFPNLQAG